MEARFGHDLRDVKIHADDQSARSAEALDANAFTIGRSISFGPDKYQPGSASGRQLLAHELTHVIQQSGGGSGGEHSLATAETEADAASSQIASGPAEHVAVRGSVPSGSLQMESKKKKQPAPPDNRISLPRKPKDDPRWLLSPMEESRFVQTSRDVNRLAQHRRQGDPFTPPVGGGVVTFGFRSYEFDAKGNLIKAQTTNLTLGVRDETAYKDAPGYEEGEDFGHLLGIDFGHIDAELGRYGGFPQPAYLNRDTGEGKAPLWYQAERAALKVALALHEKKLPYRVEAQARGHEDGRPAEICIAVFSGDTKVYDSQWIANPKITASPKAAVPPAAQAKAAKKAAPAAAAKATKKKAAPAAAAKATKKKASSAAPAAAAKTTATTKAAAVPAAEPEATKNVAPAPAAAQQVTSKASPAPAAAAPKPAAPPAAETPPSAVTPQKVATAPEAAQAEVPPASVPKAVPPTEVHVPEAAPQIAKAGISNKGAKPSGASPVAKPGAKGAQQTSGRGRGPIGPGAVQLFDLFLSIMIQIHPEWFQPDDWDQQIQRRTEELFEGVRPQIEAKLSAESAHIADLRKTGKKVYAHVFVREVYVDAGDQDASLYSIPVSVELEDVRIATDEVPPARTPTVRGALDDAARSFISGSVQHWTTTIELPDEP
jgi:hypothetical protein